MPLTYSTKSELGSLAPNFSLRGTDTITHHLSDFRNERALVVVFMCNHCPYVRAVIDRINALAGEYRNRGVAVVGINPNDASKYPEDSFEKMQSWAREKNFQFKYLWDADGRVAREYGAVCTPDFFVYENLTHHKEPIEFALRYRGQLDDNWKDASAVRSRPLAAALDAILDGKPVTGAQEPAMGCSIKWA